MDYRALKMTEKQFTFTLAAKNLTKSVLLFLAQLYFKGPWTVQLYYQNLSFVCQTVELLFSEENEYVNTSPIFCTQIRTKHAPTIYVAQLQEKRLYP